MSLVSAETGADSLAGERARLFIPGFRVGRLPRLRLSDRDHRVRAALPGRRTRSATPTLDPMPLSLSAHQGSDLHVCA
jgi:hypothetical protein